jgi:hypothetical protein
LKKLVECPLRDVNNVPLIQKKDIFNMLAAKVIDWRSLQKEPASESLKVAGKERLALIMHELSLLSF